MPVAVVAHAGKTFGGGLPELRRALAREGCTDPLWYEVPNSRKAPKRVRQAINCGADLIFVWGGDTGSVNGEHFAVMAGAGFDAEMIKLADRGLKDKLGRAAYLYGGART